MILINKNWPLFLFLIFVIFLFFLFFYSSNFFYRNVPARSGQMNFFIYIIGKK